MKSLIRWLSDFKSYHLPYCVVHNQTPLNSLFHKGFQLTQTLMLGPAAAHSQYLFGLKQRAFRMSPPSRVYKCFPSFKSHSMAIPSFPPDAHKEPSGDTVTQFRYPVCPKWLVFRRQFVRFQTYQ